MDRNVQHRCGPPGAPTGPGPRPQSPPPSHPPPTATHINGTRPTARRTVKALPSVGPMSCRIPQRPLAGREAGGEQGPRRARLATLRWSRPRGKGGRGKAQPLRVRRRRRRTRFGAPSVTPRPKHVVERLTTGGAPPPPPLPPDPGPPLPPLLMCRPGQTKCLAACGRGRHASCVLPRRFVSQASWTVFLLWKSL